MRKSDPDAPARLGVLGGDLNTLGGRRVRAMSESAYDTNNVSEPSPGFSSSSYSY